MKPMMVLLALTFTVLPSAAQKVRVDYDHGCNFSLYRTYRWVELQDAHFPDAEFPNQLMRERIAGFVAEALAAKRLMRVATGGDLLVGYRMKVTRQPQFTTFTDLTGPGWGAWGAGWGCCDGGWGAGWGGGWGTAFSTTTMQAISIGRLTVSLMDAHQNQLVFQGVSTDEISSKAEKNTKRLQKGIYKMFEKYPPQ
jgi:Domain of unknown function (DUF4136)